MLAFINAMILPEPPRKSSWRVEQEMRRLQDTRESKFVYKTPPEPKPAKPSIRRQRSRRVAMRTCVGCPKSINAANESGFCKHCWTQNMLDRTYGDKRTCQDCNSCIGRRPKARFCKPCGKKSANRSYKAKAKAEQARDG